mgnify:CR=1 FL=1
MVSIDGTKIEADASFFANRTRDDLAAQILAEAEAPDAAEDELLGEACGGELLGPGPAAWPGGSGSVQRWMNWSGKGPVTTSPGSRSGSGRRGTPGRS